MNLDEVAKALLTSEEGGPKFGDLLQPGESVSFTVAGTQGVQGEKGDLGPPGIDGIEGPTGLNGDKGDKGDTGEKGDKGDPGKNGQRGLRGEKGTTGDTGKPGREGQPGTPGSPGAPGPRGLGGPPGKPGGGGGGGSGSGSALTVKDEGSTLSAAVSSLNFAGAGVTATNVGPAVTVTIPGGGATPDLEAVLTAGNDGGALGIVNAGYLIGLDDGAFYPGEVNVDDGDSGAQEGGAVNFAAGGTSTLNNGAQVIASGGNDAENRGGILTLRGGSGSTAPGADGGGIVIASGDGDNDGGDISLTAGNGANGTDGSIVATGAAFTFNGDPWLVQAAFVEPTTATPEQIANALIAAGLMAAS